MTVGKYLQKFKREAESSSETSVTAGELFQRPRFVRHITYSVVHSVVATNSP
jgi:hypothetical protein